MSRTTREEIANAVRLELHTTFGVDLSTVQENSVILRDFGIHGLDGRKLLMQAFQILLDEYPATKNDPALEEISTVAKLIDWIFEHQAPTP